MLVQRLNGQAPPWLQPRQAQRYVQVVIALIVTPDGFPLGYEALQPCTTCRTPVLQKIETQYGKANRI